MDQGAVEPLHVVVLWEGEQDLVADDREGQEQNSTRRYRQCEGAEEQSGGERASRAVGSRGKSGQIRAGVRQGHMGAGVKRAVKGAQVSQGQMGSVMDQGRWEQGCIRGDGSRGGSGRGEQG